MEHFFKPRKMSIIVVHMEVEMCIYPLDTCVMIPGTNACVFLYAIIVQNWHWICALWTKYIEILE
jgi:hypothetical protein